MEWYFWVLIILAVVMLARFGIKYAFRRRIAAWATENGKAFDTMSAEELIALPDDELVHAVIDRADAKHGGNAAEETGKLSEPERWAYVAARYDMEFMNGGLCQYFANSSRFTAPYLADALYAIGANKTQRHFSDFVTKHGIDVAELGMFAGDSHTEYLKNTQRYPFDEFDETCAAINEDENLQALIEQYVRTHLSVFV